MRLVLIILKLLLTPAYFVNTSGLKIADPNSTICENNLCIKKCCPENYYVKSNECVPYPRRNDYEITLPVYKVYGSTLKQTGKQVQDVFVFNPNAFGSAPFKYRFDVSSISGLEAYITDKGILCVRSHNDEFDQWRYQLVNDNYCLDHYSRRRGSNAHIWVNTQATPFTWAVNIDRDNIMDYTRERTTEYTTEQTTEYTTETGHTTSNEYYKTAILLKISGTIISCVLLFIVLMVYSVLMPETTKFRNWVLIAYDLSLLLAFISLILQTLPVTPDVYLTGVVYFFYLTCFCWMNVMSFDIWWTFRGFLKARPIHQDQHSERSKLALCCLYALGLPLLMTIALVGLFRWTFYRCPWFVSPDIPQRRCFLTAATKPVYLYMPMLILTLVTWVFLLMAGIDVRRLGKGLAAINSEHTGSPIARQQQFLRLLLYLKLSVLMTLTWIVEVLSILVIGVSEDVIMDKLYLFLGLGIFVVLVCNKEIFKKLTERCRNSKGNPKAETLVTKSAA